MRAVCVSFDEVGYACFEKLAELGAKIEAIVTLDDTLREKRSGQIPFDMLAEGLGAPLLKCRHISDPHVLETLKRISPDWTFVIGWSQLVDASFIALSRNGVLGMHPTLLPMHRGRAPQTWAMIHGLCVSGVSLFHIVAGADAGNLVGQIEVPLYRVDTARSYYARILRAHVQLIERCYEPLAGGRAPGLLQDERLASHWDRRKPSDGIIDWNCDAETLYNWVRALGRPYPGAFTWQDGRKLIVWAADLPAALQGDRPGRIVTVDCRGLLVQTGRDGLWLTHVQWEDSDTPLEGQDIALAGHWRPGDVLGTGRGGNEP